MSERQMNPALLPWLGKKVVRKPEHMDMIWEVLSQSFPYFNVSADVTNTTIKLEGLGDSVFEKAHFNVVG